MFHTVVLGKGMMRIEYAVAQLEDPGRRRMALRRALNHTGDKTYTIVRRELAEYMGLSQKSLETRGLKRVKASNMLLSYLIVGRGKHIPLKEFSARQGLKGVSASPWGKRRLFKHTFIVASIGGNVFKRVGKGRLPIEKLWGPAIWREIVNSVITSAFRHTVRTHLPGRVEHEVRVLTQGIVS